MAMYQLIIKNNGTNDIEIEDLGIVIAAGAQEDLHEQYDYSALVGSDDLRAFIETGILSVNDGTNDLSAAEGVDYLKLVNQKTLIDAHFTKTQLQSAGQAKVHWENITDKPATGSPSGWYEPVKFRALGIGLTTAPATPIFQDIYVDDAGSYQQFDGTQWNDIGAAIIGDRVIDLSEQDQGISVFDGNDWNVDLDVPENNHAIVVGNDGDGKSAQYVYDGNQSKWIKTGDADFVGHMDGGSGKHKAGQIFVEGSFQNIPNDPKNVEEAISGIDAKFGQQETQLQKTKIVDGILYINDATRGGKWLSASREYLQFGRKGKTKNQYLSFGSSSHPSNNSGDRMLRQATITGITGQLDKVGSCDLHIRKNDETINIATLKLTTETGGQDTTLNIDLDVGDYVQAFLGAVNRVEDPRMTVEISWRA